MALYLRQLTAGAVEAGGITDIYAAAGVERPDLSHLDQAFIERLQQAKNPQLTIEALRRLVEQEMRRVTRHNLLRQRSFSDRLLELMRKYTNQQLTAAEIIAELVAMAKEVSADASRGSTFAPSLSSDELAFYNAVAQNESAVVEMGTGVLADIARNLVKALRRDVTTDWVSRERRQGQAPLDDQAAAREVRLSARRPADCHRPGNPPDGDLRRRVVAFVSLRLGPRRPEWHTSLRSGLRSAGQPTPQRPVDAQPWQPGSGFTMSASGIRQATRVGRPR